MNPAWQGELEHRCSKRQFTRSGKKKDTQVASIANQEAFECFIAKVDDAREALKVNVPKGRVAPQIRTSLMDHYHIASSTQNAHNLTEWLGNKEDDPAVEVQSTSW